MTYDVNKTTAVNALGDKTSAVNALACQKRPTSLPKETYYPAKRDLLNPKYDTSSLSIFLMIGIRLFLIIGIRLFLMIGIRLFLIIGTRQKRPA